MLKISFSDQKVISLEAKHTLVIKKKDNKMTEYLNKKQLETLLGVSPSTINRKLKDLPKIKIGNSRNSRVLFPRPEIDIYLRENFMNGTSKTSGGLS